MLHAAMLLWVAGHRIPDPRRREHPRDGVAARRLDPRRADRLADRRSSVPERGLRVAFGCVLILSGIKVCGVPQATYVIAAVLAFGALVLMVWGIRRLRSCAAPGRRRSERRRRIAAAWPGSSRPFSSWRCSAATAGAFALTGGAKLEPSPIYGTQPPTRTFSPACNCDTRGHELDFRLRKRRAPHRLGRARRQARAHARRRPLVPARARAARRSTASPRKGSPCPRASTAGRPPRRASTARSSCRTRSRSTRSRRPCGCAHRIYSHISPDGDGRKDVFRVPYRLERAGPRRSCSSTAGRRCARGSRRTRGVLRWNGKVDGRVAAAGQPRAEDLRRRTPPATARSRSRSRSCRSATSRSAATACSRSRGTRFAILALSDARELTGASTGAAASRGPGRCASRRRGSRGVYRLYVSSGGHAAKALVVVA